MHEKANGPSELSLTSLSINVDHRSPIRTHYHPATLIHFFTDVPDAIKLLIIAASVLIIKASVQANAKGTRTGHVREQCARARARHAARPS